MGTGSSSWQSEDGGPNSRRGGETPSSCATPTSASFPSEPEVDADVGVNADGSNATAPYPCQFCDRTFPRLSYLKKHEQVSTIIITLFIPFLLPPPFARPFQWSRRTVVAVFAFLHLVYYALPWKLQPLEKDIFRFIIIIIFFFSFRKLENLQNIFNNCHNWGYLFSFHLFIIYEDYICIFGNESVIFHCENYIYLESDIIQMFFYSWSLKLWNYQSFIFFQNYVHI